MSHDPRTMEEARDQSAHGQRDGATPPQPRFALSFPQVMAGALAAASAAVAASWLGVAGTVFGAVLASIVVSVSSALYAHPIERSSQALRSTLPALPVLSERYRATDGSTSAATETMVLSATDDGEREAAEPPVTPLDPTSPARDKRRVHWGAVAATAVLTLVAGFGILTGVEAILGQSVASLTGADSQGGTTVSRIVNREPSTPRPADQEPTTPNGTDDEPGNPLPTEPTEPQPTDPTEPLPTDPTEPAPTDPTEPAPTEPGPTSPTAEPTKPVTTGAGAEPETPTDAPTAPPVVA